MGKWRREALEFSGYTVVVIGRWWEVIGGGPGARWCAGSRLCKFLMEIYSKVVPKLAGIRWMGVESGGIQWV